ncbi:hypothetical protein [Morganella morganii]|uniref:hypothetical protein n=1 Tax=Morganella morganii TaxID=582 RepID=UPI0021D25471|nr:hypothetical protein [Morganella morganii]
MNSNKHSPQYIELMNAIVSYKKEMFDWWDSLQKTRVGEWTLLLTLACWGVPGEHFHFRLAGFLIGAAFFMEKFAAIAGRSSYTTKTETRLLQKIRSGKMSDKEKETLYKELSYAQKNRKFGKSVTVIKKTWKIMVAYTFFASSLFAIVGTNWGNIVKTLF